MTKPVKIVVWVLVFGLAAGVGAFVASRSNPFPPGVEDPGAHSVSPSATRPVSSPAGPQMWDLAMLVKSEHRLHEGGTCRSNWRVQGRLGARTDGTIAGKAVATLRGAATCDFAQSQVQTRTLGLEVTGSLHGEKIELTFRETAHSPLGSQDLGGFVGTLAKIRPAVNIARGGGITSFAASQPDGDQGAYASTGRLQLAL